MGKGGVPSLGNLIEQMRKDSSSCAIPTQVNLSALNVHINRTGLVVRKLKIVSCPHSGEVVVLQANRFFAAGNLSLAGSPGIRCMCDKT